MGEAAGSFGPAASRFEANAVTVGIGVAVAVVETHVVDGVLKWDAFGNAKRRLVRARGVDRRGDRSSKRTEFGNQL